MGKLRIRVDKSGPIVSAFLLHTQTQGAPSDVTFGLEPGDVMHEVDVPAELLERGLSPDFLSQHAVHVEEPGRAVLRKR
jgi:hypothetical protein